MKTYNAIEISKLSVSYGNFKVLDDVNAVFPSSKFSALLGINGSGKSTLFKVLSDLITDFNGDVIFFGKSKTEWKKEKSKEPLLGFLPQSFTSIFPFTVKEILLTGRVAYSKFMPSKEDVNRVYEVAEELKIKDLLNRSFNSLSGGQQQLVLIGRILVQNPKIILLDEPTNHLDIPHQHQLLYLLKGLSMKGYTVIAIMHDPVLAHQYADDIYYLKDKKIMNAHHSQEPKIHLMKEVFSMNFEIISHLQKEYLVVKPIVD